jgi:hypothetical protein
MATNGFKNIAHELDTEGEWRVEPESIHGWRVIDSATGRRIVGEVYFEEDARQIVADHKAAESQALLVEALEVLRSTLTPILRDHTVRGNVDRTEGYVLVAVNQINAALKAASELTK